MDASYTVEVIDHRDEARIVIERDPIEATVNIATSVDVQDSEMTFVSLIDHRDEARITLEQTHPEVITNASIEFIGASPPAAPNLGSDLNVFIQPFAPTTNLATYLWIQTGLGSGNDFTFWFEDGS